MSVYVNPEWRDLLRFNGLTDFDAFWRRDAGQWHEAPNVRRGGWSGVVRTELRTPAGGVVWIYIKRQENHVYRGLRHFMLRAATFEREFFNIRRFQRWGIPSLEPVYFAQRDEDGDLRAILATASLDGYVPLDAPEFFRSLTWERRRQLIRAIGEAVSALHAHRLQHGSLYAKHLFVRERGEAFDVRMIDLEKVRVRLTRRAAELRDFYAFHRRLQDWGLKDRLRLFKACRGEAVLSPTSKSMLREIAARARDRETGAA